MKRETRFRIGTVDPFLKKLENSFFMSIQQISIVGTPDKLGVINGFFIALELKVGGKVPSQIQEFILDQISKAGGVAFVVNPDNFQRIAILLTSLSMGIITPKHLSPWRDYL